MNTFVTIRYRFSLLLRIFITILLAFLLLTTLSGCYLLPEEEETIAPPVVLKDPVVKDIITEKVRLGTIENKVQFWGTFLSPDLQTLFFTDTGMLKSVNVAYGDTVKAGDVLAKMESEELDLQLAQMEINLQKAILYYDSLLKKAELNGSNNDYEIENAKLNIDSIELNIANIKDKLSKVSIIAPSDGVVTFVNPLKPGSNILVRLNFITICNPKNLTLVVKENQISEPLPAEKKLIVSCNSKTYQGKVLKTPEDNLNETNANFKNSYIIQVEGLEEGQVKLNDTAFIEYVKAKVDHVLLIDKSNIREDNGKKFVNIFKNGVVEECEIITGLEADNGVDIEVKSGLTDTDEIIVP